MEKYYRVKYRNGGLEIEIESSDQQYVDNKFKELIGKEVSASRSKNNQTKPKVKKKAHQKIKENTSNDSSDNTEIDITGIVSAINDDDSHTMIEENILNKSGQLPRIIMCLHFADDLLAQTLTTGDIQTITDQLGIKISNTNAANTIKANLKYFSADSVRKKGSVVRYKLNRKGKDAYQKLLNSEKI